MWVCAGVCVCVHTYLENVGGGGFDEPPPKFDEPHPKKRLNIHHHPKIGWTHPPPKKMSKRFSVRFAFKRKAWTPPRNVMKTTQKKVQNFSAHFARVFFFEKSTNHPRTVMNHHHPKKGQKVFPIASLAGLKSINTPPTSDEPQPSSPSTPKKNHPKSCKKQ